MVRASPRVWVAMALPVSSEERQAMASASRSSRLAASSRRLLRSRAGIAAQAGKAAAAVSTARFTSAVRQRAAAPMISPLPGLSTGKVSSAIARTSLPPITSLPESRAASSLA